MRKRQFFTALAAMAWLGWQAVAARAVEKGCPNAQEADQLLRTASEEMAGAHYQEVIYQLSGFAVAPCDPRISLLLAGAYEGNSNIADATRALESAHDRWPRNASLAVSLAREYLGRGDIEKAVGALGYFQTTAETPSQELEEAALVYIAGHQLTKAQALAMAAYRRHPTLRSLLLLANTLQLEGRYKDVNTLTAEKRAEYGGSAAFLITAAESEYDAMIYDAAKKDLEEAVRLDDGSYQAHFLLGNTLMAQGTMDRAAEEYRKAITLSPNQPRTYYQLALVARARQDEAEEEKLLQQTLAVDDHYAPAYCEQGRILLDRHELKGAVDRLNLAIQYNAQNEQAYYMLARAYAESGEKEKSRAMVKEYTKIRAANRQSSPDTHPGQVGASGTATP